MGNLSAEDLELIDGLMPHAWTQSTRESYGAGLLNWHVFCDEKEVAEEQRAPASSILVTSFIAMLAGCYSGKTISNYMSGIRAWHILHGIPWNIPSPEHDAALKAADALTPSQARREKRQPFTVEIISAIRGQLNLEDNLDAAVFACLTMAFYGIVRVGEFTVKRIRDFDPAIHIKPSNMQIVTDERGFSTTVVFIPRTKSAPEGEDVYWAGPPKALIYVRSGNQKFRR
ncbi:hypothetical protein BOTBODRAFT_170888 [Botryobasidium botryosum FD-172 SS1]|uniref:Tyr recombinase domain-containing protein n=1 Tax=Botryobasidium botryosum (strain FD-172 SS1) TaxID=930990 RepID=A0A067MW38_BOTB1|nr:hypothetical protein BOTBODRAFT_170888 [Botryobasidium botryosum FD-172 SS1]